MTKIINIIGVGDKRTSKKGWEYVPVAFTYPDKFINGVKAATVNVGVDCLRGYVPSVGDSVEAVVHESNFTLFVDAIL